MLSLGAAAKKETILLVFYTVPGGGYKKEDGTKGAPGRAAENHFAK
jgi:hypothetical protein